MRWSMAALAAAVACAVVQPAAAQDQPGPGRRLGTVPMLAVAGEGLASVEPDVAVVSLGVGAQDQDAAAAQTKVNQAMHKVLAAVKQVVGEEQVQTSGLSLYPVYSQRPMRGDEEQEPRISGYRADMSITARVTDIAKVGAVVDAGLGAGANRLNGVSFELQNDTGARADALQQAIRSAQAKARAMAAALDVELTELIEVSESGLQTVAPMYEAAAAMDAAFAQSRVAGTPIQAGQVQVRANVTLRYRFNGLGLPRAGRGEERDVIAVPAGDRPGQPRRDRISDQPPGSQPR
jgi:uncharacterized protein